MNAIADRYRSLAQRFTDLVDAVPADRWDRPSPCADWRARDVLEHVVSTEAGHLDRMAFPGATSAAAAIEGVEPISAWPTIRDRVQSALDDPQLAATGYDGMFGPTTFAESVDQFFSFDLVVHAWDLARATGMDEFEPMPAGEVANATAMLAPMADTMRMPGVFGPEVAVADDADPQTKLLGIVGRAA